MAERLSDIKYNNVWLHHVRLPIIAIDSDLNVLEKNQLFDQSFMDENTANHSVNLSDLLDDQGSILSIKEFFQNDLESKYINTADGLKFKIWKDKFTSICWCSFEQKSTTSISRTDALLNENAEIVTYVCEATVHRVPISLGEEFVDITEYKIEDILKEDKAGIQNIVHPSDKKRVDITLKKSIAQRSSFKIEYRILTSKLETRWVSDYGRILEQADGSLIIKGRIQEISEQKASLSTREEGYYRSIFDTMREGVVVQALDGKIVSCNQAALDILGLTIEQITGRDSFNPEWKAIKESGLDFPGEEHPSMVTLQTGVPQKNIIMGVFHSHKKLVWISINSNPMLDVEGKIKGVVATFSDITSIKSLQKTAVANRIRFRKLFEGLNYPIIIVNKRGVMELQNSAFRELFGYKKSEVVSKDMKMLMRPVDAQIHDRMLKKYFGSEELKRGKRSFKLDVYGVRKDGEVIPIQIRLSYLRFEGEEYAICMIKDLREDEEREKLTKAYQKITDSVRYAQRIQLALLDNHNRMLTDFKDAMIFFQPKDIVSGDFYWYESKSQIQLDEATMTSSMTKVKVLIVADCTGHGVPGAFMASLGNAFLHEIINEHNVIEPKQILTLLNQKVVNSLNKRGGVQMRDGMDMGVVVIHEDKNELHFAGAKHPLYLVRDGEISRIKGSPASLGGRLEDAMHNKKFEQKVFDIRPGDKIYMSSDGFQDQFGGDANKKFMRSKFQKLLLDISSKSMDEQKDALATKFVQWMGLEPQTDDILVIGIEL